MVGYFWCFAFLVCYIQLSSANESIRGALVVTIAGDHKLSEYFEWSCVTIGASSKAYDMLVFHESNTKLMSLNCASNVKLIDLGKNGLSKVIIEKIMSTASGSAVEPALKGRLSMMLNDILLHSPRYLVEIKPMLGDLFKEYLQSYSHWSYTDPDIIWGNLVDWVEEEDLLKYSIVSYSKNMDAGRLFLRGQVGFTPFRCLLSPNISTHRTFLPRTLSLVRTCSWRSTKTMIV
jgi:hypothetical protein